MIIDDNIINELYPYIKFLLNKSDYANGNIHIVDVFPNNFIDYMIIDTEALRLSELYLNNNGDTYTLEFALLDNDYEIMKQYNFLVTPDVATSISDRLKYFFGEPDKVDYNLSSARKFKLLKGGKK